MADALARYHCSSTTGDPARGRKVYDMNNDMSEVDALWMQIFTHLRSLTLDPRPEVRCFEWSSQRKSEQHSSEAAPIWEGTNGFQKRKTED